ncbi:MAG TPA: endonuclease/exonuclease/phosphatase family protein [Dehalococcoidia bacterium]|nr:endonuclease/exonuclease/phosphatase family protein [Dehalococcoidia bacterium]
MEVAVATFNVYKHEDFEQRLRAVLALLGQVRADIVCLQEVPPGRALTEVIAARAGYQHAAECAFVRPDDGWTEALGVLSRFRVVDQEPVELRPGVPNCFRVRLDVQDAPLDVYNVHLHPRDSKLRQREASVILGRLEREPEAPAIVCGDFNAVPEGRTMAVFWPYLRSAFEMANGRHPESTFPTPLRPLAGRQPGFSERREGPPVDEESQAKAAIDYILVRPSQFTAVAARLIGDRPVEGVWPSDHMGVLARLSPTA